MRVTQKRWGEVTIKRQGEAGKNSFDQTKSFSVENTEVNYKIEEYKYILELSTNLTAKYSYQALKEKLEKI